MGIESCPLYDFRGQLKSEKVTCKKWDVFHTEPNIRLLNLKQQKQFLDFRPRPTKSKRSFLSLH